jgi:hypothetical protein
MMQEFEDMDRSIMIDLAELYDTDTPISENERFKARYREMREEWRHELKGRMGVTRPDDVNKN